MSRVGKATGRGPMIHIRLDRQTHTDLKMLAARGETTIQKIVENLVKRDVRRRAARK